ncbi:MAG TPA: phosphate signaling complex protein PhoU [Armatimonadota bacterium]|nr:phosphate signaling complex protein PhoU [Armatimonadota bacterium]
MRHTFEEHLSELKDKVLAMAVNAENSIDLAMTALKRRDMDLAHLVIEGDDVIDEQERQIEADCIELIARQQPMAADLRLISMVLKMITDIERIADHSSDISEITLRLGKEEPIKPLVDIPKMADTARGMVHQAIRAYVANDLDMALAVCQRDDEVDALFAKVVLDLSLMMKSDPAVVDRAIDLIFIAKYLERVGDHATNIGEWVAYNITGKHKHLTHEQ